MKRRLAGFLSYYSFWISITFQKTEQGTLPLLIVKYIFPGTMASMAMGGLALLAGKALMTAMMSLVLSAVVGLKSLSSGGKSTTYEIVSKPIYSHSHSHSTAHEDVGGYGHSGYGRNLKTRRR